MTIILTLFGVFQVSKAKAEVCSKLTVQTVPECTRVWQAGPLSPMDLLSIHACPACHVSCVVSRWPCAAGSCDCSSADPAHHSYKGDLSHLCVSLCRIFCWTCPESLLCSQLAKGFPFLPYCSLVKAVNSLLKITGEKKTVVNDHRRSETKSAVLPYRQSAVTWSV